jgi:hypothetical protein
VEVELEDTLGQEMEEAVDIQLEHKEQKEILMERLAVDHKQLEVWAVPQDPL